LRRCDDGGQADLAVICPVEELVEWRVMVELGGVEGTVQLHEVSAGGCDRMISVKGERIVRKVTPHRQGLNRGAGTSTVPNNDRNCRRR
jgi:hypothetical protein